jgi:hypothetical protein
MTIPATQTKINLVAKDQLARLLARENIEIRHSPTATVSSFDSKKRILTLPVWNKANEDIYDLLVAREVGKALHSPSDATIAAKAMSEQPDNPKNYAAFLQSMESIRVERKMRQDYPGLGRSFVNGYRDLNDMGFFGTKDLDVNSLNLADRIDLYSKIGQYGLIDIQFSPKEAVIRDAAMAAESFDDVVGITRKIYYHRDVPDDENGDDENGDDGEGEGQGQGQGGQGQGQGEGEGEGEGQGQGQGEGEGEGEGQGQGQGEGEGEGEGQGQGKGQGEGQDQGQGKGQGQGQGEGQDQGQGKGRGQNNSQQSQANASNDHTQRGGKGGPSGINPNEAPMINSKMNEKIRSLADTDTSDARNNYAYFKAPADFDTTKIVIPYKTIYKDLAAAYKGEYSGPKILSTIENRNKDFVSNLVQSFEQRMAADEARRERSARTGRLDMRKIANYKFSDNLFLKNTIVPNGKNHGMYMIVDWSGSMCSCLMQTVEQILSMVFFCRRMKIPYKVLAFADSNITGCKTDGLSSDNTIWCFGQAFYEFLSSDMSNGEFRKNAAMFCQLTYDISGGCTGYGGNKSVFHYGSVAAQKVGTYGLTGTPLNQAVYNSIDLVQRFRAEKNLEIVNVFVLTDGSGCSNVCNPPYNAQRGWGGNVCNTIAIDKNGKQHQFTVITDKNQYNDTHSEVQGIVEYAKKVTGANYISIFLTGNYGHTLGFVATPKQQEEMKKCWSENNYCSYVEPRGYTESFLIKPNTKIQNSNEMFNGVSEDASDAAIIKKFASGMNKKRVSRVFLNRFADLIAKKVLV